MISSIILTDASSRIGLGREIEKPLQLIGEAGPIGLGICL